MRSAIAGYLYTPEAIKLSMTSKRMQIDVSKHFNGNNTWGIDGFNNRLERFMQYIRKKKFNEASLLFDDIQTEWKAIIKIRPDFQQFVISEIKKDCFHFLLTSNNHEFYFQEFIFNTNALSVAPELYLQEHIFKALSVFQEFYFQECINDVSAHLKFMEFQFSKMGIFISGNSFIFLHPRANSQQMKFLLCLQVISKIGELNPIFSFNFRRECSKILASNNEKARIMFQAICDGMRNARQASLIISTFFNERSKVVIEDPANLYKLRYCLFNKSISEAVLLESVTIHQIMFQNPLYYMNVKQFCAIMSHPYYFMLYLIGSFANQFTLHRFVFIVILLFQKQNKKKINKKKFIEGYD